MNVKNLFKNLLHDAETLSSEAEQNAKDYADTNLQTAKSYTDSFYLHALGDKTLTVDTELGCGYIVISPSGSWANVYFVNNYRGTCFAKTLVQGSSAVTISTSGSRFTLTTTGTNIEYYAIKIGGVTKLFKAMLPRLGVLAC